jgi:hypothetical protein
VNGPFGVINGPISYLLFLILAVFSFGYVVGEPTLLVFCSHVILFLSIEKKKKKKKKKIKKKK